MSNRRSDPDDYSDGEYQQDEQHSQKINGKIERMQLKIDELSRELTNERANHELLKQQLKASSDNGVMTTLLRSEFATFIVNNLLGNLVVFYFEKEDFSLSFSFGILYPKKIPE